MLVMLARPAGRGTCSVASGEPSTILRMARTLASSIGIRGGEPVVSGGFRLGDVRHIVATPTRVEREHGFGGSVPLGASMRPVRDGAAPTTRSA